MTAVRKKRQATFSSYTYINVAMNAQFATTPTLADFVTLFASFGATTNGVLSSDVKIDLTCPPTTCSVVNGDDGDMVLLNFKMEE